MKLAVIGTGYVGLVGSAIFSDWGNQVVGIDVDAEKIAKIKKGVMPIYEPGLEELVNRNVAAGRLTFTTDYKEAVKGTEFAFIAVGTPSAVNGEADLQYVAAAAKALAASTELDARAIAERAMGIASQICIYTNATIAVEEL